MRLQFEDAEDAANVAEVAIVGATTATSAEFNAMGCAIRKRRDFAGGGIEQRSWDWRL